VAVLLPIYGAPTLVFADPWGQGTPTGPSAAAPRGANKTNRSRDAIHRTTNPELRPDDG